MPDGHGLDALTGEFGDLFEKGVVDPARVTRLSLEHAASVAALLLTTEALVAEELIAQPGAIVAPGFGDLAEGLARPSSRSPERSRHRGLGRPRGRPRAAVIADPTGFRHGRRKSARGDRSLRHRDAERTFRSSR